jgi:hypothetical protein
MSSSPTTSSPKPSRDPLVGRLGLLALAAVALIPVWWFKYFPTTDGGAHVANADVLLQYFRPAGAAYRHYYELNPLPLPNSLGHFVLALLMIVFPPLVAEKLFISAYLLLLPLSLRYAATAVKRGAGWVAFLAVPLSLNWIFHQGFYNFLMSVAIFFFLLGYWLRRREKMNLTRAVVLGLLGLLLYAGHLLSITLACAAIFILASWYTIEQAWRFNRRGLLTLENLTPGLKSRFMYTFTGLLPAIALIVWFQKHGFAGKPTAMKLEIFHREFWRNLRSLSIMISYRSHTERPIAVILALLVIGLFIAAIACKALCRNLNRRDGILLLPLAFAALYFTRGDANSGQLFIPQRLIFYIYLTVILFLATQSHTAWMKRGVVVASSLLAIALTIVHWPAYRAYNERLNEFLGVAERIEPQSTLLPLVLSPRGVPPVVDAYGLRSMPFFSAAGYAAVTRRAIDLRNYEAGLDYFPVKFKNNLNPYKHLAVNRGDQNGLHAVPQRVDLRKYTNETGGRADYIVLYGAAETFEGTKEKDRSQMLADKADLLRQLQLDYSRIYTSPSGCTELWRNKN